MKSTSTPSNLLAFKNIKRSATIKEINKTLSSKILNGELKIDPTDANAIGE